MRRLEPTAAPPRPCGMRWRSGAHLRALALVACTSTAIPNQPRTTDPVIGLAPREKLGEVMTADGMTVYVYTKDRPRETVCYEICAMNWPPLLVTRTPTFVGSVHGRFGTVTRRDGANNRSYNDPHL